MVKLSGRKEVLETLNIHYTTLYTMVERKEIEAIKIGTKNFYNLEKYLQDNGLIKDKLQKKVCYCRVSSSHQKEDLERQVELMRHLYPDHELISEIGSGLNFKRKGFLKLLDMIIKGEVKELVVMYKDRLCRFGFEFVEHLMETYGKGKIIVVNRTEEKTPLEEITEDILSIMNIYVSKMNGLRKYRKGIRKELTGDSGSESE